eukprot:jgi/Mesvir1/18180/Mv09467-RA.7
MEGEAEELRGKLPTLETFSINPGAHKYPVELIKQGCFDSSGMKFPVTVKTLWEDAKDDKEIGTAIIDLHNDENFQEKDKDKTLPEGLFLVPGDPNLSLLETAFHNACHMMHMRGSIEPFRVLSAFRRALHHVGRVHNLKYIICDFGPSAGVLNQILVMSCDYILPCFQPDFFSASAVYGFLHNVLPDWLGIFNSIRSASKLNLTDPRFAFNPLPPRILPFLMNNFVLEGKDQLTPMDSAFFSLVERVVKSEEDPVSDDVSAQFLPDGRNTMVSPFLRSVPVALKVAQEIAQPAVLIDSAILKKHYKGKKPRGALVESRLVMKAYKTLTSFILAACVPRRRDRGAGPVPLKRKMEEGVRAGPGASSKAESTMTSLTATRAASGMDYGDSGYDDEGEDVGGSVSEGSNKRQRGQPIVAKAAQASSAFPAPGSIPSPRRDGRESPGQARGGAAGGELLRGAAAVRPIAKPGVSMEEESRPGRGDVRRPGGREEVSVGVGASEFVRGRPLLGGVAKENSTGFLSQLFAEDEDEGGEPSQLGGAGEEHGVAESQKQRELPLQHQLQEKSLSSSGLQSAFKVVGWSASQGAGSLGSGSVGVPVISTSFTSARSIPSGSMDGKAAATTTASVVTDDGANPSFYAPIRMPLQPPQPPPMVVAVRPTAKGGLQLTSSIAWDPPLIRDSLLPMLMSKESKEAAHLRARSHEDTYSWMRQPRRDWGPPPWKGRRPEGMMTNERRLAEIKSKADGSSDNDSKNAPYSDEDERKEAIRAYNAANASLEKCHIPAEMAIVNLKDGPKSIIIEEVREGYYKGNILIKAVVDGQKVKPWLRVANSRHLDSLREQEGGEAIMHGAGLYADTYLARGQVIGYHMGRILGPEPDKQAVKFEDLEFESKLMEDWKTGLKMVQQCPELLYTWLRTYLLEYLDQADAVMSCPVDDGPCRNVRVDGYRAGIGEGWAQGETLSVKHQNKKFPIRYPAFYLHMANDAFNPLAKSGESSDRNSDGSPVENANSTRSVLKASTHIFPGEEILWNSGSKMQNRIRESLHEGKEVRAKRKASLKSRIEKGVLQLMQFVNFRLKYGHWSVPGMEDWPQMTLPLAGLPRMGGGSMVGSSGSMDMAPERSAGKKAAMLAVQKSPAQQHALSSYGTGKLPRLLLYQLDACDAHMLDQVGVNVAAYGDILVGEPRPHPDATKVTWVFNTAPQPMVGKPTMHVRPLYPAAPMPGAGLRIGLAQSQLRSQSQSQTSSQPRSGLTKVTI